MTRRNEARRLAVASAWAIATTVVTSQGWAEPAPTSPGEPTSVADAVAIALRQNPDALISEYQLRSAESTRGGVRGTFGPKVHVDANVQRWNSPFDISLGPQIFRVRDAFTWTASTSLIQPLTPLFVIYDQYKVATFGVDVAAIKQKETRREIAFQVVEAYYRLLESQRLSEVAEASVAQLEGQQREAQSLFTNGVIGKNDLLRAGLALASARQRVIQSRGSVVLARGLLATRMGLSADAPINPVPFTGEPPGAEDSSVQAAETRAAAQRLELREVDQSIASAHSDVRAAKAKLLPQVNAIANYTHVAGSAFQQADATYVGLFASWDVWDWGTTLSGIGEADAKLNEARVARRKIEDEVRLEARQAFVVADTSKQALGVAKTAVSQAEENYRIVTRKFENNAATSFDVVDAESLLTQARGQVETALYDALIARAALEKATGARLPGER